MINKIISKIHFLVRILLSKNYFYEYAKSQNNNEENKFLKKYQKKLNIKILLKLGFIIRSLIV